jgi:hypothetical protein
VGKNIEGVFDETADKLKQLAQQPPKPPAPDPKLQVAQIQAKADEVTAQTELQTAPIRAQAEIAKADAAKVGAQASVIVASEKARQAQIQASMPPQPGRMQ